MSVAKQRTRAVKRRSISTVANLVPKGRSDREAIPPTVEVMRLAESHIAIGGPHWPQPSV